VATERGEGWRSRKVQRGASRDPPHQKESGAFQRIRDGIVEQTDDHMLHGVNESERVAASSTGSGATAAMEVVAPSASASSLGGPAIEVLRAGPVKIMMDLNPGEWINPAPRDVALKHLEACADHRKKRWVIAVYDSSKWPDLRDLADQLGAQCCPFLVVRAAAVPETIIIYQVAERDTHKPKVQLEGCVSRLTFVKKGNQCDKVCETIDTMKSSARETFGNLRVVRPPAPSMSMAASRAAGAASGTASGAASGAATVEQSGDDGNLEGPMYDEISPLCSAGA
jgi:hypothetical protein